MSITTLLVEDTFDGETGTVDLVNHVAIPGGEGVGAWENLGNPSRFKVFAAGYFQRATDIDASVARLNYAVPPTARQFRVVIDVHREGVDMVGGEVDAYAYVPGGPIADWDFKDCARCAVQRHSINEVSASITWVKAVGEPAPPAVQLAFAGSQLHGANQGVRFEFDFEEPLNPGPGVSGITRVYRSDFGTGDNQVLLASGVLPEELIAHSAADRLVGLDGTYATVGLVGFRVYGFRVEEVHVVATCKCLLIVFRDDGLTALWTVSTDPDHPRPYLVEPESIGEQQIDVAAGAATVTSVGWAIIDPAQIPGDQDGGFLTGLLALFGLANVGGRRMLFVRFVPTGTLGYQVLAYGPSSQPRLSADYASYAGEIRDTRETERKVRCFDLVGGSEAAIVGATPAGPEEPGSGYPFDWDVVVSP